MDSVGVDYGGGSLGRAGNSVGLERDIIRLSVAVLGDIGEVLRR